MSTGVDGVNALNATDKKPEDKPIEKERTLGDGNKGALEMGTSWFCTWLLVFTGVLCSYTYFGMISWVGRGFIACAWLLFFWACVHVRYAPKPVVQCPRCQYRL